MVRIDDHDHARLDPGAARPRRNPERLGEIAAAGDLEDPGRCPGVHHQSGLLLEGHERYSAYSRIAVAVAVSAAFVPGEPVAGPIADAGVERFSLNPNA